MTDDREDSTEFDDAVRRLGDLRLSEESRRRHLSMLADLTNASAPDARPPRRRARRGVLVIGAAVVVASGVGIGTAVALGAFSSAPPTDRRIAHCYTTANLSDPSNHEDFAVASGGNPSLRDAASSALDICRGGWLQGRYSAEDPKIALNPKPPPWHYPVPPLIACVLKNGQVGVFPGQAATCQQLGLSVAEL